MKVGYVRTSKKDQNPTCKGGILKPSVARRSSKGRSLPAKPTGPSCGPLWSTAVKETSLWCGSSTDSAAPLREP